jgi:hypothetical protein
VIRQKDGRRNRYRIQAHLPVPEPAPGNPLSARWSPCSQPGAGPHPCRPQAHIGNRGTASPPPIPPPVHPPQMMTH